MATPADIVYRGCLEIRVKDRLDTKEKAKWKPKETRWMHGDGRSKRKETNMEDKEKKTPIVEFGRPNDASRTYFA
jgi:hypothetical protein